MTDLELRLPDEVMENMPSGKDEMLRYLSKYFDTIIDDYDRRLQKRVSGLMGQPLSKYERSMLKDMLIDLIIGRLLSGGSTVTVSIPASVLNA